MYIKKILLTIVLIGFIGCGSFAFFVYQSVFFPNTNFETETVILEIPLGTTYTELRKLIHPLLKESSSFDRLASKKGYIKQVKSGHFVLKKDSNNNEIINLLNK